MAQLKSSVLIDATALRGLSGMRGIGRYVRDLLVGLATVAEREAPSLLHYLHERNLVPGPRVALLEIDGVGNTIRLHASDRDVTMSRETAGKVWVLPE